jgi:phosphoribosyl 1,2-cyclic phosphodiesterase
MFVKIWGSRGSIPVSGQEYIKYGGDTTCIEIRTKNGRVIIIDAGTGIRRLGKDLLAQGLYEYDLIFTHAHWDHVMGFPFFRPLYSDRTSLRVHGCPFAEEFVRTMLTKIVSPPNFPVNYGDLKARIEYSDGCPEKFQIDSVTVMPIDISHPGGGKGYKFIEDGRIFVFLTDHEIGYTHPGGLPHEDYLKFCASADLLVHDAEFTGEEFARHRSWGHSAYLDTLNLAMEAGVKQLALFHINQDRTDKAMDKIVDHCRRVIRESNAQVEILGACCDMTFEL